jgi:C1A family cysteine protease
MITLSKDLRSSFSPIRDQGARQTCMAFAASDAHAVRHNSPMSDLSVEYAHYHACKCMPRFDPHEGTSVTAMLAAIRVEGQPPEAEWPYMLFLPTDLGNYMPPANVSGVVRSDGKQLPSLDAADLSIEGDVPVIMGIALSLSFYHLRDGSVLAADSDHVVRGKHAVLAVGRFSGSGDGGYLIRNSWGTKWGASGYGLISRGYIDPRVIFLGAFHA